MKKKSLLIFVTFVVLLFMLTACSAKGPSHEGDAWKSKGFDLSLPNLEGAGVGKEQSNDSGWYATLLDDFDGEDINDTTILETDVDGGVWTYSPHAIRWESQKKGKPEYSSYWCPDMVRVENGNIVIQAIQTTNHICSSGVCPKVGRFTGGIETRAIISEDESNNKGQSDKILFDQAFGYFETRVKLPNAPGLWSAFWLQSSNMRMVGNGGEDGTEIDIFESAFLQYNKTNVSSFMGHALIWDGYGESSRVDDYILETSHVNEIANKDLYDGYHTFALKWTPEYYVFYIDGVPTYASNEGGVSKVAEFLRFTVEIDAGDEYGPHGMKIGPFDPHSRAEFMVDYVKVYQNEGFLQYEKNPSDFKGSYDGAN